MSTVLKTAPSTAEVAGHQLKCLMCHHESFHKRRSHFDMSLATTMNPDWADRQAYCYVCDHCGFVHWFIEK